MFLTNNSTLSALTSTELYRCRWQVERFFKWVKQHLRLSRRSDHADGGEGGHDYFNPAARFTPIPIPTYAGITFDRHAHQPPRRVAGATRPEHSGSMDPMAQGLKQKSLGPSLVATSKANSNADQEQHRQQVPD